jgi:membrane protease YdiL (CAAX protease family)
MSAHRISRTTIVAVLIATTAALVGRSWLQVELRGSGIEPIIAADLSYLVVPPILVLLLFPLWKSEKRFLADQFRFEDLTWRLVGRAFVIGLLIRILWWSQLVTSISLGIYKSTSPEPVVGPEFSFQCGSSSTVLLGLIVMAMLVPLIEEIMHRGFIQSALQRRGTVFAIVVSASIFAVFHKLTSWPFAFLGGVVFGIQYWSTRSLWPSFISHATFNGLIQLDWRCASTRWNPKSADIPMFVPGLIGTTVFIICLATLLALLTKMATEAKYLPR